MNYQKIYNQLIEKRQQILVEGYSERHHIIPRCMGGSDSAENLVRLTAREHFIAHVLLVKIYRNASLMHAANMMSNFKKCTSKKYSWLKKLRSENYKGELNGMHKSKKQEYWNEFAKIAKERWSGGRNPKAKKWLLISPAGEEIYVDGNIQEVCSKYNINFRILVGCLGKPYSIHFRHINRTKYDTHGWTLKILEEK